MSENSFINILRRDSGTGTLSVRCRREGAGLSIGCPSRPPWGVLPPIGGVGWTGLRWRMLSVYDGRG